MRKTKAQATVSGHGREPEATVTPMEILVKELVADLKALEAKIPHFQYPHPRTTRLVRTYRSVPKGFIKEMNDCVRYDAELQAVGTYDATAGAEALDFVTNFRDFSSVVGGFLRGLNFTIEYRHAEVAEKALQTYQIAKALRRRKGSSVVSKVPRMRAALNRAGKKRGGKKETKE